jgi:hypothetical protein
MTAACRRSPNTATPQSSKHSSSQCLRLTDQCLIRSEAFGFAKPWWSFIVDERKARQGSLRAVQCGQEIVRRVAN